MNKLTDEELRQVYKDLDAAVAEKNIDALTRYVKEALSFRRSDKRFKRAVYQYASLYRRDVEDLDLLENELALEKG